MNAPFAKEQINKTLKLNPYKLTKDEDCCVSGYINYEFDPGWMYSSGNESGSELIPLLQYIAKNIKCDTIIQLSTQNSIKIIENYYRFSSNFSSRINAMMTQSGAMLTMYTFDDLRLLVEIHRLTLMTNMAVLEIIPENRIDIMPIGLLQYAMAEVALKILQINSVKQHIESQQKNYPDIEEYVAQLKNVFAKIAQHGKSLESDPSIKLLSQPISFDGIKLSNACLDNIMDEFGKQMANLMETNVSALGEHLARQLFSYSHIEDSYIQLRLSRIMFHYGAKSAKLDVTILLEYAHQLTDRIKSDYSRIFLITCTDNLFPGYVADLLRLHSELAQHILDETMAPTNSYDIHCLICLKIGNIIKQLITDLPKIILTDEQKTAIQQFDQRIKQKLAGSFQGQELNPADLEWLASPGAIAAYRAGATPAELENLTPKDTWLTKEEELDEEIKKEVEEMKPCIIKAYKNRFTSPHAIEAYRAGAKFTDLKDALRPNGPYDWLASPAATASYKNGAKFEDLKKLPYLEYKMFDSYATIEVYEAGATFDDLKNLFPSQTKNKLEKVEEINEYLAEFNRFVSMDARRVYKEGGATFTDLKQLPLEMFKILTSPEAIIIYESKLATFADLRGLPEERLKLLISPEAIIIYESKLATFADLRGLPEERLKLLTSRSIVEIYKLEEAKFTDLKNLPEEQLKLLTSFDALYTYRTKKVTFTDLKNLRDLEEIKRFISTSARYAYHAGADFSTLKSLPQDRFQLLTSKDAIKAYKDGAKFVDLRDLTYEQIRDFVPSSKANTVINRMGK